MKKNEVIEVEVKTTATIKAELDELLAKRNEYARNGAGNMVTSYENKIADKIKEYTEQSEEECFDALKSKKNIMLEAAKVLSFGTYRLKNDKDKSKKDCIIKALEPSKKNIDPKRLHDYVQGGIGRDANWVDLLQKLNFLLTSRRAVELGIDPEEVHDSYDMSVEADKITSLMFDAKKYDKTTADDILRSDMQAAVDAMIGDLFIGKGKDKVKVELADTLVNYMLMIYQKKDKKKALSVTCAKHDTFREYMLEVCHRMAFGTEFTLNYQHKKVK